MNEQDLGTTIHFIDLLDIYIYTYENVSVYKGKATVSVEQKTDEGTRPFVTY
jgi:hypothetical protein